MSNISWMYKNKIENVITMTETYGTINGDYGTSSLADGDLQSYFSGNSESASPTILFDFGSVVTVDSFIVVSNHRSNINNDNGVLSFNAGDTNPPTGTNIILRALTDPTDIRSAGTAVRFLSSSISNRYFKLSALIGGTAVTHLNEVFIGKRDTLPINPEYPLKKELMMFNIVTQSEKGKKFVYNKYDRLKWDFKYSAINDALYGTLNNMRDHCGGSYKPFFICIDKDDNLLETYFVRIARSSWKHTELIDGSHDISFSIEEEK